MDAKSPLTSPTKNTSNECDGALMSKLRSASTLNCINSRFSSPLKTHQFQPTSSLMPSASTSQKQQLLACHNVIKRRRGNSVRRTLFGKPDPKETTAWLEELSKKIMNENIEKWGFDFRNDKPLENGNFEYEPVNMDEIPKFYHPTGYSSEISTDASSMKEESNIQQLSPRKASLRNATKYINNGTIFTSIEIQQSNFENKKRSPIKYSHFLSPSKIRKSNSSPATHKTPKKKLCL